MADNTEEKAKFERWVYRGLALTTKDEKANHWEVLDGSGQLSGETKIYSHKKNKREYVPGGIYEVKVEREAESCVMYLDSPTYCEMFSDADLVTKLVAKMRAFKADERSKAAESAAKRKLMKFPESLEAMRREYQKLNHYEKQSWRQALWNELEKKNGK